MRYFGTDGVRGEVGKTFTPEFVARIARAIITAGYKKVVIGHDTRASCAWIMDVLRRELAALDITEVGVVPTIAIAFLTPKLDCDLGIMVTASHNPPKFNGIKLFDKNGRKLDGEALYEIDRLVD